MIFIIANFMFPVYIYLKTDPQKLYSTIDKANKIVITKNNVDSQIIYTSTNIKDIKSFKQNLYLKKSIEWSFPACRGSLGINLYHDNQRIARIGYLTDSHIREASVDYIAIEHKDRLEKWFSDRNISIDSR